MILREFVFLICVGLTHNNFNSMCFAVAEGRNDISVNCISVNNNALDTFAYVVRVRNLNVVSSTAELTSCR